MPCRDYKYSPCPIMHYLVNNSVHVCVLAIIKIVLWTPIRIIPGLRNRLDFWLTQSSKTIYIGPDIVQPFANNGIHLFLQHEIKSITTRWQHVLLPASKRQNLVLRYFVMDITQMQWF